MKVLEYIGLVGLAALAGLCMNVSWRIALGHKCHRCDRWLMYGQGPFDHHCNF